MPRITISYRPDGAGFTYEIRDLERKVVKTDWCAGAKTHAQNAARRERAGILLTGRATP